LDILVELWVSKDVVDLYLLAQSNTQPSDSEYWWMSWLGERNHGGDLRHGHDQQDR
jgi:hypothetical protein